MNDGEFAKELLKKGEYACVIVKDRRIIYTSKARGIYPLYEAGEILGLDFRGAFLADKVIGKAAAMIAVEGGIRGIYGEVMSQHALDFIRSRGIQPDYRHHTPYIKNRDLDGMCPVETRAITTGDYGELIGKVEEFLISVNMKVMENTLVMIKPDAFSEGRVGEILSMYESRSLKIVAAQVSDGDTGKLGAHYEAHRDQPFYPSLLAFMAGGPMMVLVLRGLDGVAKVRAINGTTDPLQAVEGTIRKSYGSSIQRNAVHGSASREEARREIGIWFPEIVKENH
jgi:nucleoside-diphosphate kinase